MVGPLPPGALTSRAAADRTFDIPTEECCFTGCCDRGKAFLLDQLDERADKDSHDQRPHP
ncbi:hypothetical protein CI784_13855 [Arthrobacter agilis]|uniref:hypothetical protein n=1 Tax=Arthrobacter agilis TaxID=37921 RepID=UPI000B34C2C1|nr:hypothetical protein [Arthrobacter agilis]OUM40576.1 hypothetical protein B8W74_13825 [Arthrobacter agilis]PPB45188.1 hypothetical protein CI784_13855 [Arthrobacter agilis]WDF34160.1 hypothetical protein PTW37_04310 [Arthrobacter agilis]